MGDGSLPDPESASNPEFKCGLRIGKSGALLLQEDIWCDGDAILIMHKFHEVREQV